MIMKLEGKKFEIIRGRYSLISKEQVTIFDSVTVKNGSSVLEGLKKKFAD